MKKTFFLFVLAACLFSSCDKNNNEEILADLFFGDAGGSSQKPQKESDPLSEGLVAYYPFEGNANDESGHKLNGKVFGNVYSTEGHKNESQCVYFLNTPPGTLGGNEGYISVPFSNKLKLDEWTINLWFYYEDKKEKNEIFMRMGDEETPGSIFIQKFRTAIVNTSGEFQFCTFYEDESEPSPSESHMLTSQVKGKTFTLYLDGVLMSSENLSAEYKNQVSSDLYFGGSASSYYYKYNGCLDDVRIYNRILSESEIKQLYSM